jgi:formylglycine-generating enzyme required for sulfatase activity
VDFASIPGGWFWMGWDEGRSSERPRHRVFTSPFAIGRTPVTNREYGRYLDETGSPPPRWWREPRFDHPEQPVVGVSWFDATAFCEWLTGQSGWLHRLPTEAEWEKAARGGLDGARFPWGDERPPASSFEGPVIVSDAPVNAFGLFALSGVCHEWCLDWDDDRYYSQSPERDPRGPSTGTRKCSRGGAWRHQDPWSPVAHRSSLPPALQYSDYGFRVARPDGLAESRR